MVRISETQDYQHAGIYHFIQTYQSTWIDEDMQEPVDGEYAIIPLSLETDLTKEGSVDISAPHIYVNDVEVEGVNLLEAVDFTTDSGWVKSIENGVTRYTHSDENDTGYCELKIPRTSLELGAYYYFSSEVHRISGYPTIDELNGSDYFPDKAWQAVY